MSTETELVPQSSSVLDALRLPTRGKVYDLASGWWRHMPVFAGFPQFEIVTYNSPQGQRSNRRFPFDGTVANPSQLGYFSELLSCGTHTGTHIDALSHVTCGARDEWHGGVSAQDSLGDFGASSGDAAEIGPLIRRGVLLDIPTVHDRETLPPHYAVTAEDLDAACVAAGVSVRPDDVVLVRTGQMRYWPDVSKIESASEGSGVGLSAAEWLVSHGVRHTGADTQGYEARPAFPPVDPLPVHKYLLHDHGVYIMEWVNCEGLAADGVSEFLFVALPLSIQGASGSPIRPVGIV